MKNPVYRAIASKLQAMENCRKSGNDEWLGRHRDAIAELVEYFPKGSGFDAGTSLDLDVSTPDKLVFNTSFHHMDDGGGYASWTEHRVTVRASLAHGYEMKISGRDRNDIKELIEQSFSEALDAVTDL